MNLGSFLYSLDKIMLCSDFLSVLDVCTSLLYNIVPQLVYIILLPEMSKVGAFTTNKNVILLQHRMSVQISSRRKV